MRLNPRICETPNIMKINTKIFSGGSGFVRCRLFVFPKQQAPPIKARMSSIISLSPGSGSRSNSFRPEFHFRTSPGHRNTQRNSLRQTHILSEPAATPKRSLYSRPGVHSALLPCTEIPPILSPLIARVICSCA